MRKMLLLAVTALVLSASVVAAGELSVGAVGSVSISPYKSYDVQVLPFPFITYKDDRFYVKGSSLGVHLYKDERHEVSVGASYLGLEFRPSRTDNRALKHLDKRRSTLMADASYSFVSKIGLFRAQIGRDVLGFSDGYLASASMHVPWITDTFVIMPGAGVQWASSKHNDYYFGVSRKEANRSGLNRYQVGRTFSPFATLEAKYKLSECWDLVAKGKVEYLNGRIKHSPMVGKSYAASFMAGVQYNF